MPALAASRSSTRRASAPRSRFTRRSPHRAASRQPADLPGQVGPEHQALPPRGEAQYLGAVVAEPLPGRAGVVLPGAPAQVRPRDVDQASLGEAQRLPAAARPPGEADRRVERGERDLQQRQRRVAAGHHQGRPQRPDRQHLSVPPGHDAAGGREAGLPGAVAAEWQGDEGVPQRCQRHPGAGRAQRCHRPRRHRRGDVPRAEQLLGGHSQGPGERERDPQRRVGMTGLHRRDRLPRHPRHVRELLLGEPARLAGQAQPRARAGRPAPGHADT